MKEKKAAAKEFEDKKIELKENLIAELEEKKKMIENEKLTMELTGGKEDKHLSFVFSTLLLLRKRAVKVAVLVYRDSWWEMPMGQCTKWSFNGESTSKFSELLTGESSRASGAAEGMMGLYAGKEAVLVPWCSNKTIEICHNSDLTRDARL